MFHKEEVQQLHSFPIRYLPSPDNSTPKPPEFEIQDGVELEDLNKRVLPESWPAAILVPSSDIATERKLPSQFILGQ